MIDQETHIIERDYELALQALNDPEFRCSKEFVDWLKESPEHYRLLKDLMSFREALLHLHAERQPDVDRAWNRFSQKRRKSRRRPLLAWLGGAAAVVALLLAIRFFLPADAPDAVAPEAFFTASTTPQEVTLSTGTDSYTLTDASATTQELTDASLKDGTLEYGKTSAPEAGEETVVPLHTLTTPRGKTFNVVLDDGTRVWLNAESRLRYPARFSADERRVELEGEAYFSVSKDADRPFIVKSGTTETRVLGTEFNFSSYDNEARHIVLVEGSVLVSDKEKSNSLQLHPGEAVTVEATADRLVAQEVDVREYTAWRDNLFCFRHASLADIMRTIGRWYNLSVTFTDEKAHHYHFNFWVPRAENPQEVLDQLNSMGKVDARLEGNEITIKEKN